MLDGKLILAFGLGLLVAGTGAMFWRNESKPSQPVQPTVTAHEVTAKSLTPDAGDSVPAAKSKEQPAPTPWRTATKKDSTSQKVSKPKQPPVVVAKNDPVPSPVPQPPPPEPTPVPTVSLPPVEPPSKPEPVITPPPTPKPVEPRKPRNAMIPAGTLLTVRLTEPLAASINETGYHFRATLDHPLIVSGMVLAERGSRQTGTVTAVDKSGRVKGRASLTLQLTELSTADGQKVEIQTEAFVHEAPSSTKSDVAKAGAGAAIGAAIGAIAGGGKGAAIGAAIGGAAGAGTVLATRGADAKLPEETRISFRLKEPVTLTEKID